MIVIGIDPGYAITGWAVLNNKSNKIEAIDYGAFQIPKKELYIRMIEICDGLDEIIDKYKPTEVAIEKIFFNKNVKTAIDVAQIRGAIALSLKRKGLEIFDYTPLQVKQAIVGYGRAEKMQIQNMIKILLNLKEVPKPDDVADALAIGVCHCNSSKLNKLIKESL